MEEAVLELSPTDARNAKLITSLLACAKCLRNMERDGSKKFILSMLESVATLYPDADTMEAEVLALARQLNFEVEQRYTQAGSAAIQ